MKVGYTFNISDHIKYIYDKALYILSLKLITTHTLSCNFNNTIELC